MSVLFLELKSERLKARKKKDVLTVSILTTLLGELETKSKKLGEDVTNDMVIATCKKFIANNDEVISVSSNADAINGLRIENVVLTNFLPKQLTEDELRTLISVSVAAGMSNVGQVMGHLKKAYGGQYDGRMASTLAKELT